LRSSAGQTERTPGARRRRRTLCAFTLLEVLIAMAIASLTLVTALAAVSTGLRNEAIAKLKSRASMLAREKLSELEVGDYPDPDPAEAVNKGADEDELIWIDEGEFEEPGLFGDLPETWRSDFYWQTILESTPGMKGIRTLTLRIYTKRYRARPNEARWKDYITKDYQLLVEIVTYRSAHYYSEGDVE
jgi:prepilin-type N-terminal cleavage/methylation domain-containing protein